MSEYDEHDSVVHYPLDNGGCTCGKTHDDWREFINDYNDAEREDH